MKGNFILNEHFIGKKSGEFYVGNTCNPAVPLYLCHLITFRLGSHALAIHGEPAPGFYPLFIGKSEYDEYASIMDEMYESAHRKMLSKMG